MQKHFPFQIYRGSIILHVVALLGCSFVCEVVMSFVSFFWLPRRFLLLSLLLCVTENQSRHLCQRTVYNSILNPDYRVRRHNFQSVQTHAAK